MKVSKTLDWWSRHPLCDGVLGVSVSAAYLLWRLTGQQAISVLDANDRGTLYATIAGVSAGLLAFGLTPTAIVLALTPGQRLKSLLRHHSDELRRALTALLMVVLVLLASSLLALAIDTGAETARWLRYVILASAVATMFGCGRIIWHFNTLLQNVNRDQSSNAVPFERVDRHAS
jgi:hypothetical protein